ncbi:biotin--[acetyl-CoA-carboxylase] ligase [Roseibium aestuarii]|uniref:biotin--[biotin carboxyl-carrier protein] ligase n=1 Tax=Roseibium aestuarii TaxID=2600299 RepID=A0ABW4JRL0_9HYPH|nr:biotin--[acetyl-CoA-carboxylase] ligase [Roseibium aestuarii]
MKTTTLTGPASQVPGLRIERHDSVLSTMVPAFERAREGVADDLWIIAREQTGGRGRRGRLWTSPPGNLYTSHLMVDPQPRARIGELPLVAAVALAEAVERVCGFDGSGPGRDGGFVRLKWPNDLLIGGAKVSGILLEAEPRIDGRHCVVLGIGVNCQSHPEAGLYATTDLRAEGFDISPDRLFEALIERFSVWRGIWQEEGGFSAVRTAWLARAAHLGMEIGVRNGSREIRGIFRDLDATGHLILECADGEREIIFAGDVFLGGS